VDVPDTR
jgi:hypothetical protein